MKEEKTLASWKYLALHLGAILLITLVILIFIVPSMEEANRGFARGFIGIIAISFLYGVTARFISPKVRDTNPNINPYHGYFFKGTIVLTSLLTLFGVFGSFFVYIEHDNLFQAVGLATSIIWIAVFLIYFMWSVYHYNINYGLTDSDWEKIYATQALERQGFPVNSDKMDVPASNPYRSQTFGLPPGTVRGMIAFTLLMGGMSLLIASIGSQYSGADLALLSQQFEFFETAFLMMIAFYFGDKSLKHLKNRWSTPSQRSSPADPDRKGKEGRKDTDRRIEDDVNVDDRGLIKEDQEFSEVNDMAEESSLTKQKTALSTALVQPETITESKVEYVQIKDNLHSKVLNDMDIKQALEELQNTENIHLSLPVIKAIISVESAGRGHLPDSRAKILFEGHKFWYWLKKFGKDPQSLQKGNENIIYEKWAREHYKGGAREYDRLDAAKLIDPKAAVYSASWGLFQILGENLEHFIKGRQYKDVGDFEEKQHESEYFHFLDFLEFIKTKKTRGKSLINYISEENPGQYDWESFAYGYNGSGYKVNKYDVKLKAAYEKFKAMEL